MEPAACSPGDTGRGKSGKGEPRVSLWSAGGFSHPTAPEMFPVSLEKDAEGSPHRAHWVGGWWWSPDTAHRVGSGPQGEGPARGEPSGAQRSRCREGGSHSSRCSRLPLHLRPV